MKHLLIVAAAFAALGVALGAFGAHALKSRLAPEALQAFETGVRYQMYHVFAIIAAALIASRLESTLAVKAGWLFAVGIVLFSGSLYGLVLGGLKWLGPVTPLGGLAFIAGWITLAIAAAKSKGL